MSERCGGNDRVKAEMFVRLKHHENISLTPNQDSKDKQPTCYMNSHEAHRNNLVTRRQLWVLGLSRHSVREITVSQSSPRYIPKQGSTKKVWQFDKRDCIERRWNSTNQINERVTVIK